MTAPRIASNLLVGSLIRIAEAEGGFGAVLSKGDERSGAILLLLRERSAPDQKVMERAMAPDGEYRWAVTRTISLVQELQKLLDQRRQSDPDLWIVELDIPSIERFTAEMTSFD